ncbi:MAG TPA: nitronate monooxygenase [Acidobacteriaceae bacterium]|nr:nitronate monooxygenase [Acidobacteriaceae bacterium]
MSRGELSPSGIPSPKARAQALMAQLGLETPILLAPMSGACPPALSIAVANAGGMGACGALLMEPKAIAAWVADFRAGSQGPFQINLWIPEEDVHRDSEAEARQREFLAQWGPAVTAEAGEGVLPDFPAQCAALLELKPTAVSSIMGLFPADFVAELKARGILWLATASTAAEARLAEAAGADAVIAQGSEAGGHRGAFHEADAESQQVGLFALLPQIVDAVNVPVIAAGGIGDGRGVAAAMLLGASAVVVGTGFLRSPEAGLHPAYANQIGLTEAHQTRLTRAYSGRAARGISNAYVEASAAGQREGATRPAAYPVQRGLTKALREAALKASDTDRMQMWAGQAAKLARTEPAGRIVRRLWQEALLLLA